MSSRAYRWLATAVVGFIVVMIIYGGDKPDSASSHSAPSNPQEAAPQPPLTPSPTASAFQEGLQDRTDLERWYGNLSGEVQRGAVWWSGRRSLAQPGACNGPTAMGRDGFIEGCEASKARLAPTDLRRKESAEYRKGWNSYSFQQQ